MSDGPPIIVCALEFERKALLKSGVDLPARIETCGPGREGVNTWVGANRRPEGPVILAGLGGGLVSRLALGATVFVDAVVAPGGKRIETTWRPSGSADWTTGSVTSTSRTVTNYPAKRSLHAVSGADLVDLESQTFAEMGRTLGWTFGIVRGIGDGLEDPLPPGCDHWVNHRGRVAGKAVLSSLLREPSLLGRMRTLQRNGEQAMKGVAACLASILRGNNAP
jgi:hypothetical protein